MNFKNLFRNTLRSVPLWVSLGTLAIIILAQIFGAESSPGFFLFEAVDRALSVAFSVGLLLLSFYAFIKLRLWDRKGLLDVVQKSPLAFSLFIIGICFCITWVVVASLG